MVEGFRVVFPPTCVVEKDSLAVRKKTLIDQGFIQFYKR
jgi:hypothetical protein